MSFRCHDILNIPTIKTTLLGGNAGMDNVVRWVYVAEAMETIHDTLDWLIGDELIIITGSNIEMDHTSEIMKFIGECSYKKVAGVVINTGRYIPEVSDEVVRFSDELKLPLFEVPWETRLVEFTKDICAAIINKSLQDESNSNLLDTLLFGDISTFDNLAYMFSRYGFYLSDMFLVGILNIDFSDLVGKYNYMNVKTYLSDLITTTYNNKGISVLVTIKGDSIIFLIKRDDSYQCLNKLLSRVIAVMESRFPGLKVISGIGKSYNGIDDLKKSYQTAQQALKVLQLEQSNSSVMFYDDKGIYSLLLSIKNTVLLQDYFDNLFLPVIDYDKSNHAKLMKTLEVYLNNNAKLSVAAKALFIHENTLKYRFRKNQGPYEYRHLSAERAAAYQNRFYDRTHTGLVCINVFPYPSAIHRPDDLVISISR